MAATKKNENMVHSFHSTKISIIQISINMNNALYIGVIDRPQICVTLNSKVSGTLAIGLRNPSNTVL